MITKWIVVPQNDYSITFFKGGGSLQMITIDYIGGRGLKKPQNWLRNTAP